MHQFYLVEITSETMVW